MRRLLRVTARRGVSCARQHWDMVAVAKSCDAGKIRAYSDDWGRRATVGDDLKQGPGYWKFPRA
eukprot:7687796-Alexandrium_andersonii.AAC.1